MGKQEKHILVTGSSGFIGKNLIEGLGRNPRNAILRFDIENDMSTLEAHLKTADIVYHVAGVNRPQRVEEFEEGNVGLTERITTILLRAKRRIPVVLSSSIQAALDNPYGISKKKAEDILFEYGRKSGAPVYVYRIANVFGKWCRPNYNSVVATFCHNIAHGLEITISDPSREIELVYIDDVVDEFLGILSRKPVPGENSLFRIKRSHRISLGELAGRIYGFQNMRKTLVLPDLSDYFTRALYATYLANLDEHDFSYAPETKMDARGNLAELIKSEHFGQIFVSTTRSGVVRGNHYHNTKVEKFCVLSGRAAIRFRQINSGEILTYNVSGDRIEIVDIPPGYTHSIENLGDVDMVVLFWASQIFDPENPDTYQCEV